MKAISLLVSLLLLASTIEAKLSLQECQRLAYENSEKVAVADLRVWMEKDRVDEVWGLAMPKISAEGQYLAAGEATKFLKKHKKANAKVSLIMPLFNFGGASNRISAQETLYEASLYGNYRVKQELTYVVAQAYYRVLEAQKITKVIQDSLKVLKAQLHTAKDFYEQGLVHKNDAILFEVQMAQREQDLLQAQQNEAILLARLNRLIGNNLSEPIELEDILEHAECPQNLEGLIANAKATHPELLGLQVKIGAAYYAYKAEKGNMYPAVYAFSDYSTTNDYEFPYKHGINVGLGVSINLYDGGMTLAKVRRLEKEHQELKWHYQELEEEIELSIRSAYLKVQSAAHKIPIAQKSIGLSHENLRMTQDQYGEGLVTSYDILNDEERTAQARLNYYQALYEFHTAHAELSYAAGVSQNECNE